jgi:hypothetical protein
MDAWGVKGGLTRRRLACVVAIALVSAGGVLLATRDATSAGADSAVYVGTAESIASGHGINVPIHYYPLGNVSIGTPPPGQFSPRPTPLVVYAPLEPVLLSVGGHPLTSARIEDTILFSLAVLVIGLFVLWSTAELWLAAAAQLVVAGSVVVPASDVGTNAVSVFLTVVALASVIVFRARPRRSWLIVAALAVGVATLERYADGGLIVWGALALRRKHREALAFLVVSSIPLAAWFMYEHLSGRGSGHFVGLHVVGSTFRGGARSVADWVLPASVPTAVALLGALAVVVAVYVVVRRRPTTPALLLLLFAFVQIVALEIAITFFDALVNLDSRELIPCFIAVVMALACSIERTTAMRLLVATAVVASVARGAVEIGRDVPLDYRTARWTSSPVMAAVGALPRDTIVYSNAPDAIYLLDRRSTSSVPEMDDFSTRKRNPRFLAQLAEIGHTLATRGGVVVYVRGLHREYLPSEGALVRDLSLRLIRDTRDGAIYGLSRPAA